MYEVKIWVMTGLLTVLLGVGAWAAKTFVASILKKLDAVIAELRSQGLAHLQITNDVHRNGERIKEHHERLADHDKRITTLERYRFTSSSTSTTEL